MEIKEFLKEELEGKGIFELRFLARKAGVNSPTTMKKEELISNILSIQEGVTNPQPKSKRGRPVLSVPISDGTINVEVETVKMPEMRQQEKNIPYSVEQASSIEKVAINPPEYTLEPDNSIIEKLVDNGGFEIVQPKAPIKNVRPITNSYNNSNSSYNNNSNSYNNNSSYNNNNRVRPNNNSNSYSNNNSSYNNNNSYNNNSNSNSYNNNRVRPSANSNSNYNNNNSYNNSSNGSNYNSINYNNNNQYQQVKSMDNYNNFDTQEVEIIEEENLISKKGILDIHSDGYGFLRISNCENNPADAYISAKFIKSLGLRKGDMIEATAKSNTENKPVCVVSVEKVNGENLEDIKNRPLFDNLIPIFPNQRLRLEAKDSKNEFAIRCIDLISPIGKGQRAMIVSPPKAGKTTLLKTIANSISKNNPEAELIVLLIDERPEEVTDIKRSITNAEIIYSTFDETPEHHTKAAELVIENAKRRVEQGKDVIIIMDSLTRLARAYNVSIPPTGRTLSGGIDPGALHSPKRFFGAARNIEEGGSLTIIATALIDTGSRMDEVIFEEFKGTGNMEIHLDRKLSEKRIFPAIDLNKSGTRREDLLLTSSELQGAWSIRKMLSNADSSDATESLLKMLVNTASNNEFIKQILLQYSKMEKDGFTIL